MCVLLLLLSLLLLFPWEPVPVLSGFESYYSRAENMSFSSTDFSFTAESRGHEWLEMQ